MNEGSVNTPRYTPRLAPGSVWVLGPVPHTVPCTVVCGMRCPPNPDHDREVGFVDSWRFWGCCSEVCRSIALSAFAGTRHPYSRSIQSITFVSITT